MNNYRINIVNLAIIEYAFSGAYDVSVDELIGLHACSIGDCLQDHMH